MKTSEVTHFFEQTLRECKDAIEPIRLRQQDSLEKYMCRGDYSKKKSWQAKLYVPLNKPKSKRATSLIKGTLLKSQEYFDFDSPRKSENDPRAKMDLIRCNFTKRLVRAHLDARTCGFVDNFTEALEAAFGYAAVMILKWWVGPVRLTTFDVVRDEAVIWEPYALKCKAVDPFMFDFTEDRSIQIEHEYVAMPDVWRMVDEGVLTEKNVKKLDGQDYGNYQQLGEADRGRLERLGLAESKNEYRRHVLLSHYWGPLINKDNRVEKEHCHFIMGNEKFLLTDVLDNPYPDNSTPYVFDSIIKVPFRHIGKSLTEDVNAIEEAVNRLTMIQLDNQLWQLLGVTEVDQMALDAKTKQQLKEVYPGQMVLRRPGAPEMSFKRHEIGTDPSRAIPLLQQLQVMHDGDGNINALLPASTDAAQMNATSQDQGRMDALAQFEGFATDLERGVFTRCIDKARDLIIQYLIGPMASPSAEDILGQEGLSADQMSEEQKRGMIVSEYDIRARGISVFFEKMKKVNSYTGIYKILNSLPPEAQGWIKFQPLLADLFAVLPIDSPQDVVKTPEEYAADQKKVQDQQQAAQQFEMQKIMAPLETKIKQTQMGTEQRLQAEGARLQSKQQAHMIEVKTQLSRDIMAIQAETERHEAEMESKERDRDTKLLIALMELKNELKQTQASHVIEVYKMLEQNNANAKQQAINLTVKTPKTGKKTAKKTADGQWTLEENDE